MALKELGVKSMPVILFCKNFIPEDELEEDVTLRIVDKEKCGITKNKLLENTFSEDVGLLKLVYSEVGRRLAKKELAKKALKELTEKQRKKRMVKKVI